jgi:monothiol glutaredoxin
MADDVLDKIKADVEGNRILLYMKGSKSFPQCGFSARVVQILNKHGVDYETRNVLADPAVREGVKRFSNWPTIPQLYVGGQFIGGCDIVTDLEQRGELAALLKG